MIKKEEKYFIIKQSDIDEFFDRHTNGLFSDDYADRVSKAIKFLIDDINKDRLAQGKIKQNQYILCNQDEPYAELVWQIILQGERVKELAQMVKKCQNQIYGKV